MAKTVSECKPVGVGGVVVVSDPLHAPSTPRMTNTSEHSQENTKNTKHFRIRVVYAYICLYIVIYMAIYIAVSIWVYIYMAIYILKYVICEFRHVF